MINNVIITWFDTLLDDLIFKAQSEANITLLALFFSSASLIVSIVILKSARSKKIQAMKSSIESQMYDPMSENTMSQNTMSQNDGSQDEASQNTISQIGITAFIWQKLIELLSNKMYPKNKEQLVLLQKTLLRAGYVGDDPVLQFAQEKAKFILIVFPISFICIFILEGFLLTVIGSAGLIACLIAPTMYLKNKSEYRSVKLRKELPLTVDLLLTCVDSGLSLHDAFDRIGRDLKKAAPTIADELRITSIEIAAHVPLATALKNLATRTQVEEVETLCSVLSQADGLGAPITESLENYIQSSRRSQLSKIEETAGALSAKITLPLTLFFMPVSMVLLLGPPIMELGASL